VEVPVVGSDSSKNRIEGDKRGILVNPVRRTSPFSRGKGDVNPKLETISNDENSNVPNKKVWRFWILEIRICFGFRYSNFGF
jgi:hypothetical protein